MVDMDGSVVCSDARLIKQERSRCCGVPQPCVQQQVTVKGIEANGVLQVICFMDGKMVETGYNHWYQYGIGWAHFQRHGHYTIQSSQYNTAIEDCERISIDQYKKSVLPAIPCHCKIWMNYTKPVLQ